MKKLILDISATLKTMYSAFIVLIWDIRLKLLDAYVEHKYILHTPIFFWIVFELFKSLVVIYSFP